MKKNILGRAAALLLAALLTIVAVLSVAAVAGCGTKEKPSDTIEKYYLLIAERKFSDAYALLAEETKTTKLKSEEEFVSNMEGMTPQGLTLTGFSVISENIEGDRAKVRFAPTFEEPGKESRSKEIDAELVKEDGKWKIIL